MASALPRHVPRILALDLAIVSFLGELPPELFVFLLQRRLQRHQSEAGLVGPPFEHDVVSDELAQPFQLVRGKAGLPALDLREGRGVYAEATVDRLVDDTGGLDGQCDRSGNIALAVDGHRLD